MWAVKRFLKHCLFETGHNISPWMNGWVNAKGFEESLTAKGSQNITSPPQNPLN